MPTAPSAPPDRRLHVAVVCSGNICRSPIGEKVITAAVAGAGLTGRVRVTSAGTDPGPAGSPMDPRAARVLAEHGYPTEHLTRGIGAADVAGVDLVLAADRGHLAVLRAMTDQPDKIRLLRSFDPDADTADVPDPYCGPDAGYDDVLAMVLAAAPGVIDEIRRRLR